MKYILERLKEPSSWAAISSFAAIFAHNIPVPQIQAAATAVAVVGGVVGVFAPEVGSKIQQIGSAASEGIAKKP